jgi:acyl dehydratase
VTNQRDELVLTANTSLITRSDPSEQTDGITGLMPSILCQDATPEAAVLPCPALPNEPESAQRHSIRARPLTSVSVGAELPPRTVHLTTGDLVNYAGISGDPNPIHWHTRAAELIGLEHGVVAQGMLTMALGAGIITSWLDDPGALQQYCVRMTSPVYVAADGRTEIEYRAKVKSVDPDTHTAVIALTATHNGRKIFGRATATVQLS